MSKHLYPDDFWEHEKEFCRSVEDGGPKDLADYDERLREGTKLGREEAEKSSDLIPSATTIQAVHAKLFGEVYPFAGELRDKEYLVTFGENQMFSGAFHSEIKGELSKLFGDTFSLFGNATSILKDTGKARTDAAQAITFHHTKLHYIQPFQNGNTRTALIVSEALANRYLPKKTHSLLDMKQIQAYRADRQYAQEFGVIKPLGKTLFGIDIPKDSPHPIEVKPYALVQTLKLTGQFVSLACDQTKEVVDWTRKLASDLRLGDIILKHEPGDSFQYDKKTLHISDTEEKARAVALQKDSLDVSKTMAKGKELEEQSQLLERSRDSGFSR